MIISPLVQFVSNKINYFVLTYYFCMKGNADAVRKWLWRLEEHQVKDVLVLPGHHLYEMDYGRLISAHRDTGAHITMAMAANGGRNYDPSLNFLLQDPVHELKLTLDSVQDQSLVVSSIQ